MKNNEVTYLVPARPLPEAVQPTLSARARYALALGVSALMGGMASAQSGGGGGLEFDVSSVQASVMTILGVGVAIAIAFAIYRVGKRGTNKI